MDPNAEGARVRLADTHRLDARGGWLGGPPGRSETLDIRLVSEEGQWRIDNPVNALVVPTSFFDRSFARFNLYFYDQTGRVLLPDPVFIPRGEQTATNLVRGLLAGPGSALSEISRSALPSRTDLDLSVVVTESGVAEVPLSRDCSRASPAEISLAVDQLAWTLRQVPGIERVRITVGGAPVPLSGGRIDAPVTSGTEFDAAGPPGAELWGLRGGRVVELGSSSGARHDGTARPARVLDAQLRGQRDAAQGRGRLRERHDGVRGSGGGRRRSGRLGRPSTGRTSCARRTTCSVTCGWSTGRLRGAGARRTRQPGAPAQRARRDRRAVAAFSVARDGSRLAVAYAGSRGTSVRVTDILRTDEGIVSGAGRSRTFAAGGRDAIRLGGRRLARPGDPRRAVAGLGGDQPGQLHLRRRLAGGPELIEPSVFRGAAQTMVVDPDSTLPLRLITPDQRLYTLSGNGNWPRTDSKVVGRGVRALSRPQPRARGGVHSAIAGLDAAPARAARVNGCWTPGWT